MTPLTSGVSPAALHDEQSHDPADPPQTDRGTTRRALNGEVYRMDVLLVHMPFGPIDTPSLALSQFAASLTAASLSASVRYFSIDFAERVGIGDYCYIADGNPATVDLVGEWIFSHALNDTNPADSDYPLEILMRRANGYEPALGQAPRDGFVHRALQTAVAARPFIEWCADEILAARPRIVALTSTFQQHTASLALMRCLKAKLPQLTVMVGGANCEGPMGFETFRSFPFVDIVVSGEGDLAILELAKRVCRGESCHGLVGVHVREAGIPDQPSGSIVPPLTSDQLDALPPPDFGDYFTESNRQKIGQTLVPRLLIESSRGCWWGAKHHCTFCGLNGDTMTQRTKHAATIMQRLETIAQRWPDLSISFVDNILDMRFFRDLIPRLGAREPKLTLFAEVKANLKKQQLLQLREAGFRFIQPGIESLSDHVLVLMKKGITSCQNVQFLKWCAEFDIHAAWNILWGFPGETVEDYTEVADRLSWLHHLQPPGGIGPIRMDRFSPNFANAAAAGFRNVSPCPAYRHIYHLDSERVANMAYYFTHDGAACLTGEFQRLRAAVTEWQAAHPTSKLVFFDSGEGGVVLDSRGAAGDRWLFLTPPQGFVLAACDGVRRITALAAEFATAGFGTAEQGVSTIRALTDLRLIWSSEDECVALTR
jgi:ribosomal peptide maturation radical SAM protein 1